MPTGVNTESFRTDTIVRVQKEPYNEWEEWAGDDINLLLAYYQGPGIQANTDKDYWEYRGQASACITSGGSIARVRIGNGTNADKDLYLQTLAPSQVNTPSAWEVWAKYTTGPIESVCIVPNAAGPGGRDVYYSNLNRIWKNGAPFITVTNPTPTSFIRITWIEGTTNPHKFYALALFTGPDGKRLIRNYYFSSQPSWNLEPFNNDWYWQQCVAVRDDRRPTANVNATYQVRACPYFAATPRSDKDSDAVLVGHITGDAFHNKRAYHHVLKGSSGRAGVRRNWDMFMTGKITGAYYLIYCERHFDEFDNPLSNLHSPVFWQRAFLPTDGWTEPTPTGHSLWGLAGIFQWQGYVWLLGNGKVLRRKTTTTEVLLTDYVLEGNLEVPRDNGKGTGTILLANPEDQTARALGMIGNQLTYSPERRCKVQLGQERFLGRGYNYMEVDDWWISDIRRIVDDNRRHVELTLGDYWHRLENEFRDSYYFPGQYDVTDWNKDGQNVITNYYAPKGGTLTAVYEQVGEYDSAKLRYNLGGKVIHTAWKGWAALFSIDFMLPTVGNCGVYYKYIDERNYLEVKYFASTGEMAIQKMVNGKLTKIIGAMRKANRKNLTIGVDFQGERTLVYDNGVLIIDLRTSLTTNHPPFYYGHIGAWANPANWETRNWHILDYESPVTSTRLIRLLLAHAGYLYIKPASELQEVFHMSVVWGPQTDLKTPAEALRNLLESGHLQVLWAPDPDQNQRPTIFVDQYEGRDPATDIARIEYVLQDEIIESDQVEQSHRRPNVISVDGNENSWTQYYRPELLNRGGTVNKYLDLPEIETQGGVRERTIEELYEALRGFSPGGTIVWRNKVQRMDLVRWIDADGNATDVRVEGFRINFNQSTEPFMRADVDTGPRIVCVEDPTPPPWFAYDKFKRDVVDQGWGTAEIGGDWVEVGGANVAVDYFTRTVANGWGATTGAGGTWNVNGTAADYSVDGASGLISIAPTLSRSISLPSAGVRDLQFDCQISVNQMPASGGVAQWQFFFRDGLANLASDCLLVVFSLGLAGNVSSQIYERNPQTALASANPLPAGTIAANTVMNVNIFISGANPAKVWARIWKVGTPKPGWQIFAQSTLPAIQVANGYWGILFYDSIASNPTMIFKTDNIWLRPATGSFLTDGNIAQITVTTSPSAYRAYLTDPNIRDQACVFAFALSKIPLQGSLTVAAEMRRLDDNNYYRIGFIIRPDRRVEIQINRIVAGATTYNSRFLVPGLLFQNNVWYQAKLHSVGIDPVMLRAKIWKVGLQEPAEWMYFVRDVDPALATASGSIGIKVTGGSGLVNLPITVSFDNFAAW